MDARTRLRQLGQLDLGAWIEAATGRKLWSIQQKVATAASKRRARVAVPSCNASGKSWLAGRLALAFYDAFTPGTPCVICGGPCGGAKILTTSSTHEHLRDALWSEMRIAYYDLVEKGIFDEKVDGKMGLGDNLRLESGPDHFIIGKSPKKAEGFQGFHAPHKLILGDEATSLDDEMQQGITGLLATADSRLLLIFNPTTDDTYAALETRSPRTEVIRIRAWDTPHFTGEEVPEGANLTTPEWLEELKEKGMGPGCFDPETEILTQRGWVKIGDATTDDRCITRDDFGRSFWAPITKVHRYHHTGYMVRYEGAVDLFVTPGHRFPLEGRGLTSVVDFRAEEFMPRLAFWQGEPRGPVVFENGGPGTGFKYRRWEFEPEDFAAFLGWYVSEGHVSRYKDGRSKIVISQMPGRPETEEIRLLLKRMGLGAAYSGHQFSFACAPLADWLDRHVGSGSSNKRIPTWVLDAETPIHMAFLNAYEQGDGHTRAGGAVYTTNSPGLRDDLQALMGRHGISGGWSSRADGVFYVRRLSKPKRVWLRRERMRIVPYDGEVFCISTPHQTFLARRGNAHPFWSGNTYEWTTRVEAEFWTLGDDVLITGDVYDKAFATAHVEGTRALGVDLAPYGSDENVIAYRDGNGLVKLEAFPAMDPRLFFEGPVTSAAERFSPDYLIFDADGVGAGAIGYAEDLAAKYNQRPNRGFLQILPFRGGIAVDTRFNNARSAWWWAMRRRFTAGNISLAPFAGDQKLREQITDIRYSVTQSGDIKVEPKDQMKRRGKESPDRADAVMYAFSLVEELPVPAKVVETPILDMAGVKDRSVKAMRERDMAIMRGRTRGRFDRPTPWSKLPPGVVWDDIDAW